ncbi:L-2-hydroxyglutarate oxidase [Bacillus sp. PS06]|uniref:L-2-hydroxyglutarate oxidase n=1 Tax=Bacillus sp. PS06 TaxID=2764176 RepID=UPI00177FDC1F|nr:L-2-hydroxyglutarate oxidase [Bacillus sp. PS06]MBD8067923.1 L-2-hydroxyglutarate oxidase [Bacillus sp. PS06]
MLYDYIVIGGGIVGLSTAYALKKKYPHAKILIVEKEETVAAHQTGRNSGVIHSGIYYKPGSLKARLAQEGSRTLINFCQQNEIEFEICGKLIVATDQEELLHMDNLYHRGLKNGLSIKKIGIEEMKEYEPNVAGIAAIHVPTAGIVNYKKVAQSMVRYILENGGELKTNTKVENIIEQEKEIVLETSNGTFHTSYLINCAGLFSDRMVKLQGIDPQLKIIPFRGEYFELKDEKKNLVNNLIYPVPNPKFPFLGVHLTRMIDGSIHVGPNAVLAFKREGYKKTDFNMKDFFEVMTYPPFWQIAKKNLTYGMGEMYRSINKKQFLTAVQKLVPAVQIDDLIPSNAGVRAQALTNEGELLDDFKMIRGNRSIHVCNAPSPAATASLSIGEEIVEYLENPQSLITV